MSFDKQHVMGAAAEASEPALVASLPEPLCVSSLAGDGQAQQGATVGGLSWGGKFYVTGNVQSVNEVKRMADEHEYLSGCVDDLRNRLKALTASSRQEERLASAVKDFRWRANQCRTNLDAYDSSAAAIWDLAADALEGK